MRPIVRTLIAAASLAAVSATALPAQTITRPVTFGISGGASIPTGDRGNGLQTGYNVNGLVEVTPVVSPLGLRVEAGYHRFDFDNGGDGNSRLITGVANGVLKFPGTVARPYLIGGAGVYNLGGKAGDTSVDSETKFGLNGGAGIDIPLSGLSTFIEARYHSVFTEGQNFNMFPVTVGIRF